MGLRTRLGFRGKEGGLDFSSSTVEKIVIPSGVELKQGRFGEFYVSTLESLEGLTDEEIQVKIDAELEVINDPESGRLDTERAGTELYVLVSVLGARLDMDSTYER